MSFVYISRVLCSLLPPPLQWSAPQNRERLSSLDSTHQDRPIRRGLYIRFGLDRLPVPVAQEPRAKPYCRARLTAVVSGSGTVYATRKMECIWSVCVHVACCVLRLRMCARICFRFGRFSLPVCTPRRPVFTA